jgi:hypothetical protein
MAYSIGYSIPIGALPYFKKASLIECDDKIRSIDSGLHRVGDSEWLDLSRWLFYGALMAIGDGIVRAGHNVEGMRNHEDLVNLERKLVSYINPPWSSPLDCALWTFDRISRLTNRSKYSNAFSVYQISVLSRMLTHCRVEDSSKAEKFRLLCVQTWGGRAP